MVKNIAVFGATGFPGLPVVNALMAADFHVSVLSSDVDKDRELLPPGVTLVEGNWMYHRDLKRFLSQQHAVYCSLQVDMHEQPEDFHAETDGLREIINAAQECGIRRIALMSSVLQYNQVENENLWWVFNVKKDAVNYVRDCGIPHTIFYPSTFMENLQTTYRHGKTIRLHGSSSYPIYFISVKDYAAMVVRSFQKLATEDREYFLQGGDCYKMQEAAALFIKHYNGEKLKLKIMPQFLVKLYSIFDSSWKFRAGLADALNNNNEMFIADDTWAELGKPEITLTEFARNA